MGYSGNLGVAWSTQEKEVLQCLFPNATWPILFKSLPNRTQSSIRNMAKKLSVRRSEQLLNQERREKLSGENNHFFGKKHTTETCQKLSKSQKNAWQDPVIRANRVEANRRIASCPESREKRRQKLIGRPLSIETKRRISEITKGKNNHFYGKTHTDEHKRKMSEQLKGKHFSCPTEFKKGHTPWNKGLTTQDERLLNALRACHSKPNRKEWQLTELINQNGFPFKYTGDGSFVIGGYIPDFVNCNGKKQIIELFGDYWHTKEGITWHQTELGRMMAYAQFGYRTLIVWEHELKEPNKVTSRIRHFAKRRRQLCQKK